MEFLIFYKDALHVKMVKEAPKSQHSHIPLSILYDTHHNPDPDCMAGVPDQDICFFLL